MASGANVGLRMATRKPYKLQFLQLGNEERVDEAYFKKFKAAG